MKYVICYVTDNNDLYSQECATKEEVDAWIAENEEYKAIVIGVPIDATIDIDYHT